MKKILSLIIAITLLVSFAQATDKNDGHGDIAAPSEWALESIEKAYTLNILNSEEKYNYIMPITREKFCELIYNYIDVATSVKNIPGDNKNPFTDTENNKIYGLYILDLIKGKSETEFKPDDFLTREEAAVILIRLINKFYPDWAATQMYYVFEDSGHISAWAMNSIQVICNMGIMKGVENNCFAPKDNLTTEQAVSMIMRVYNGGNTDNGKWDKHTFADKLKANMPDDKNYMISPFSIKVMLTMAANGASGKTREEILRVTGVSDPDNYNKGIRNLIDRYSQSDILKLDVSNSVWVNSDKTPQRFKKSYEEMLFNNFDATSGVVTDKTVLKEINGWVNEKTKGKIPEIIKEENKNFAAMLINAIYFKGRWANEFYKGATKEDEFTFKDGTRKNIDFMNRTAWINYQKENGKIIVELPYLAATDVFDKNGNYVETKRLEDMDISMYLIMSEKPFLPEAVLKGAELKSTYIALSVPKFNIGYDTQLNDILKIIGINKAFDKSAQFDKMFDSGNLWLDSVIHKTYIKVDEEGTEAAAVTLGAMAGSARPPEPVEVKYNKPFTFVIKDNLSGEILFVGEYAFEE